MKIVRTSPRWPAPSQSGMSRRMPGRDREDAGAARDHTLMLRAISGVLRNTQCGELPVFAWTLGLPQQALLEMVERCFPELGALEGLSDMQYASLKAAQPPYFQALAALLMTRRTAGVDEHVATWLAHAIAAACHGERHLWEDLDLGGRDDVSRLLERYFHPLYLANSRNLRWKRFLFAELGAVLGRTDCLPPGCHRCDQHRVCFPESKAQGVSVHDGIDQEEH